MKPTRRAMLLALGLGAVVAAGPTQAALAVPAADVKQDLVVPGDDFYPESIAATPDGAIFVSSITTGQIDYFPAGSTTAKTFVPAGVNHGTAGILVDPVRKVLWACDVDLSFQNPTVLKAFSLNGGAQVAAYTFDHGVCADIALHREYVYVTDTTDPTASPQQPARILRLRTLSPTTAAGGTLTDWSDDPAFTNGPGLQINGIAIDADGALYTTNYSTGELLKVQINQFERPGPVLNVNLGDTKFVNPDGIRFLRPGKLLVTENPGRLSLVDTATHQVTLVNGQLDQPTSVVVVGGSSLYVSEGQDLRLQQNLPPNLPFKVRYLPAP
jgi:sugar lactone lactonase YvrE